MWTEQGIGDAVQFGRYLALLDVAGVKYRFMTRKPLLRLFRDWFGLGERVMEQPMRTDPADQRQQIPLLSLPRLFGTEMLTIPSICPYVTAPEPTPDHLRVSPPPGGISVGFVWATNHQNRRCTATRVVR